MFIEPDEHVIIMEDVVYNPFSIDDIKKLEDGGVRTIFLTNIINWKEIYSPTWNDRNWDVIDRKIEKYLNTNLKLLIHFHGKGLPERFWWKDEEGWLADKPDYKVWSDYSPHHIPDYGNEEYTNAVDDFAFELFQRYSNYHNKIQFIYAIPDDGEFPFFPHWPTVPIPFDVVMEFILDIEHRLSFQFGEVWTNFHNQTGIWNAENISEVYRILRASFLKSKRYAVQFEHFIHPISTQMYVKKYAEEYGVRFFVGSNYCEGLHENLERGVEQGIWGFLTAPMHYLNDVKHTKVEDWMIPVIQKANKRLCEVWNDRN